VKKLEKVPALREPFSSLREQDSALGKPFIPTLNTKKRVRLKCYLHISDSQNMKQGLVIMFIGLGVLLAGNSYAQEKSDKKGTYKNYKLRSKSYDASDLLDEANELKTSSPSNALNKVKEALALSLAEGDVFMEAKCYVLIGEINENIQEWALAKENYEQAYPVFASPKSGATEEHKKVLRGLGNTNLKLNQFEASLRFNNELLSQRLSTSEKQNCQLDISEVYFQMGDYDLALKTVDNIAQERKISAPSFSTRAQNQKAKILARMNNLDKSQSIFSNSLNQAGAEKPDALQKQSVQETKEEIADVLRSQKKYDEEIDLRNKSIEYNLKSNDFAAVTSDKVEIGKTLIEKGENTAALKELEEAAKIADTLNNPKEQANAFLAVADQYDKSGRSSEALSAYKKYSQAVTRNEKLNEVELAEKSNLLKQQKDIVELSNQISLGKREEKIEQGTLFRQQLIIYGLLVIIAIIGVTSYFIYKNAQASKKANQLLALKSLRSQMNPHFIFNALNSVNHFVAQQDERTANKFLSEFSLLMRLVMENSQEDFISLQSEQEILTLYLKLEHYRFRDKFDYEIINDQTINSEAIEVPPMLIQPYIENAVWHGLRYKEEKGKLVLRFSQDPENLVVEITDDGIGRKKSQDLKTVNQKKHNSTGLKNIQERLSIINTVYNANYRVSISDLDDGQGTHVKIFLPLNNR
jgi:tetratricopeptide (TPR) repeat protein/anti-sigma regulatory factor (Ser/Thr protein kinase)